MLQDSCPCVTSFWHLFSWSARLIYVRIRFEHCVAYYCAVLERDPWSSRSELITQGMFGLPEKYKYMNYMRDTLQGGWGVKSRGPIV